MKSFDQFAFSASASFDEAETRRAFAKAVALKTVVIHCYDPRARAIPDAVATLFGDEVFPGHVVLDPTGNRVASTTTIFPIVVAGGRAVDALLIHHGGAASVRHPQHRRRPSLALRRDILHG